MREVDGFRDQLELYFRDNPSLHGRRLEIFDDAWPRARRLFLKDVFRDWPALPAGRAALEIDTLPRYLLDKPVLNPDLYLLPLAAPPAAA